MNRQRFFLKNIFHETSSLRVKEAAAICTRTQTLKCSNPISDAGLVPRQPGNETMHKVVDLLADLLMHETMRIAVWHQASMCGLI